MPRSTDGKGTSRCILTAPSSTRNGCWAASPVHTYVQAHTCVSGSTQSMNRISFLLFLFLDLLFKTKLISINSLPLCVSFLILSWHAPMALFVLWALWFMVQEKMPCLSRGKELMSLPIPVQQRQREKYPKVSEFQKWNEICADAFH